jgi:hypothetical protein
VVDDTNIGVTSAALRNSIQGPISNLFHAHNNLRS